LVDLVHAKCPTRHMLYRDDPDNKNNTNVFILKFYVFLTF